MSAHTIGDALIEPEFHEMMNKLAHGLDEILNGDAKGDDRKVGFMLLVFNFGDEGRANYISNAERLDMAVLLREQLARIEGRVPSKGGTA